MRKGAVKKYFRLKYLKKSENQLTDPISMDKWMYETGCCRKNGCG